MAPMLSRRVQPFYPQRRSRAGEAARGGQMELPRLILLAGNANSGS